MYKTTILYQDGDYTCEKMLETDNELMVLDEGEIVYLNEQRILGESKGKQGSKLVTVYAINKNALISMELNKENKENTEITRTIKYADGRTETFIESNRNQDKDSTIVQNINIENPKTPEKIAKYLKDVSRKIIFSGY